MLGTVIIQKKHKKEFEKLVKDLGGTIERVTPILNNELVYDVKAESYAMIEISDFAIQHQKKNNNEKVLFVLFLALVAMLVILLISLI